MKKFFLILLLWPYALWGLPGGAARDLAHQFDGYAMVGTPWGGLIWSVVGGCRPRTSADLPGDASAPSTATADIARIMEVIRENYPDNVTEQKLRDAALKSMLQLSDPHATLLNPEEYAQLIAKSHALLAVPGIGLELDTTKSGPYPTVLYTIPNSPAHEAGIRSGDLLIAVNGRDSGSFELDQIMEALSGEEGSVVTVAVLSNDSNGRSPKELTLLRRPIAVPNIHSERVAPGIGYIDFSRFTEKSGLEMRMAIAQLMSPGDQLILDLRGNPSGLLEEAVYVASLFLDTDQPIVTIHYRESDELRTSFPKNGPYSRMPLVILVNGNTASASEVLAGALQDHGRAIVIGSKTYGKGSVQQIIKDYPEPGYAVKKTIATYELPSGRSINGEGLETGGLMPNVTVNVTPEMENQIARERRLRMLGMEPANAAPDKALITAIRRLKSHAP
ncbi:MAG: S41 family peptidase [Elusimicrobia bacterium]|nr:S41 family peptidase [Elusimicrobiota bacterium]